MKRIAVAAVLTLASVTACAGTPPAADKVAAAPVEVKELVKKDTKVGTGKEAARGKAVLVNYTGWLYDPSKPDMKGAQFDTSTGRATPFGFVVGAGRVIKGWDEGIPGMKEGGHRTLIIPPAMGYGAKGAGDKIPPNATLLFEVELIKLLN